jgi:CheY-like chemotaxis protein
MIAEVVTLELALKRALVPLATAAHAREIEVVCEVLPGVGEYVLGDRRELIELVGRVAAQGVGAARGGDVHIRVARQRSGLSQSNTVLVSVSIQRGDVVEDVTCAEISLALAERTDDAEDARELASTRILVVVPTVHAARVHIETARRFGALVDSVLDAALARDKIRDASKNGAPFDVLYIDDKTPNLAELLDTLDAASRVNARTVLATAVGDSPLRRAYEADVDDTLSKPVLPRELCTALGQFRNTCERETLVAPPDEAAESRSPTGAPHRASGLRNLRLAEVLASLAVAPARKAR